MESSVSGGGYGRRSARCRGKQDVKFGAPGERVKQSAGRLATDDLLCCVDQQGADACMHAGRQAPGD